MISVDTKLVALLGNPLGQSLSTRMQGAAFSHCKLNYEYLPIETRADTLRPIVAGIRGMNFAGLSVTKPDKIAIMQELDSLDEFAEKIGAVNTVVVQKDGALKGYNTDGAGFIRSLGEHYGKPLSQSRFVCLGAGGAARAICCSLAYNGAMDITVTSLFDTDSEALVKSINERFAPVASVLPWGDWKALEERAAFADVIINATGVGMGAHTGESPVSAGVFHKGMLAFDAAYNPAVTRFLSDAAASGCETMNGLGMLLYQGTAQFELWTGIKAPEDVMRAVLESSLGIKT